MTDIRKIENPFFVKVERDFDASVETVFDAWLDGKNVGNWLFATPDGIMKEVDVDPREGGRFIIGEQRGEEYARHVGRYHLIDKPKKIIFSYYYETGDEDELESNVVIEFKATEQGCSIILTHEMDDVYAEYEESAINGWTMIFDGLDAIL
ncbi:MAG: SRPBCC domain-containing protein [Alphaproteobacteria bacterium]|nr:SRPBCC domain-containing protein [Alphaproteobacteria bacterium]HPF45926.1 SRPBCC domain-containing protein [Emcibacteraceae bacterium]HRW28552.1 SRPBCC domain-containing protein [Emcibacteraceae bacterium]